jgi:hypothetical protein
VVDGVVGFPVFWAATADANTSASTRNNPERKPYDGILMTNLRHGYAILPLRSTV